MTNVANFLLCVLSVASGHCSEPPIVGRPEEFSGAMGGPFVVTMEVDRKAVVVEEPMTLTLQIVGPGNLKEIARPSLGTLGSFRHFAVDDLDDDWVDGPLPTRTFRYRIRARSTDVARIPPLKFVYFNPAILPASRGYQTTYADAIPIEVKPATRTTTRDLSQRIFELRRRIAANPNDKEARRELAALRLEVNYPSDDMRPSEWNWPIPFLGPAALILTFVTIVIWIRWHRVGARRYFAGLVCSFGLAILCALGAAAERRFQARSEEPLAVVKHDTPLRRGNGVEYPQRIASLLPAGAEVRRLHERSGWLQVELANGTVGWVASDAIIP